MGNAWYDPAIKAVLDTFLLKMPNVIPGKMFGYPAYYIGRKLFACVYEDAVGLKVPADLAEELLGRDGIVPFMPMGRRKMKEWIRVEHERPEDYVKDSAIFEKSAEHVAPLAGQE